MAEVHVSRIPVQRCEIWDAHHSFACERAIFRWSDPWTYPWISLPKEIKMIDQENKILYVDYSTTSLFNACKEKCRLGSVIGYRPVRQKASLTFGSAFHAGIAAYYDAIAGGSYQALSEGAPKEWIPFQGEVDPTTEAKAAFLRDLKLGDELPLELESAERRSIERGLALLEAYIYRWQGEPYENILIDGKPLTEVGFKYYITTIGDCEVWYVGYIDRIMRSCATGRPVNFETKTTTQALSQYVLQVKPNHQITGYYPGARQLVGNDLIETVWDCTFVSDRKPDMNKALRDDGRFWMYGIDTEKDFQRQITRRSERDITEFKIDVENVAAEYFRWLTSNAERWPRTAPGACHQYGGCQFRDVCVVNGDMSIFNDSEKWHISKWEPWRRIVATERDAFA